MHNQALWDQISIDELTTPKGEPLHEVLARESRLGRQRAGLAVAEYRRWRYLRALLGDSAVPPPPILQIEGWHLAGEPQMQHQRAWAGPGYGETLAAYRAEFGMDPPQKLWPSTTTLRQGDRLLWWQVLGALMFLGGILAAMPVLTLTGVLLAALPTLMARLRGPWTAAQKPSHDSPGSGTD
ncbi:hypothetical protein [Phaeovulum sp.]|uniref:hypothetical protein n=1 Tax=Phaeovulum sp. TaxID=2934796 RepID=UPI003563DAE3